MATTKLDLGPVSAYALAVQGGYTGTMAQFEADMGNSATNATAAAKAKEDAVTAQGKAEEAQTAAENAVKDLKAIVATDTEAADFLNT